jgi:Uri superfamily endonuclease
LKDSRIYSLIVKLDKNQKIKIGKLGRINFKKGFYIYTGSALNGLRKRIERYRKKQKKLLWHMDYLLANKNAKIVEVFIIKTNKKLECRLNKVISTLSNAISIMGFGCSDCGCDTHLYYFDEVDLAKFLGIKIK